MLLREHGYGSQDGTDDPDAAASGGAKQQQHHNQAPLKDGVAGEPERGGAGACVHQQRSCACCRDLHRRPLNPVVCLCS
jgi:hypothetical protein